jgi:MerR family transcriptional regulator, repressor of the yfmOP operon
MKRFKIDDVAKETGLTKRTIRYYEEIGLIKPPKRSEKGTRLYSEEDIEQLKKVIAAREVLGFSLQELHHFLTLKEAIESHRFEYRNAVNQDEKKTRTAKYCFQPSETNRHAQAKDEKNARTKK